jgi:hypothetical protein
VGVSCARRQAIVQERLLDWSARFGALGLHCLEMTGDTETTSWADLADVDIMCVRLCLHIGLQAHLLLSCTLAALTRRRCAPRRSLTTPGAQRRPHCASFARMLLTHACVITRCAEKFDAVTRRNKDKGSMSFFADIGLFLIDEVHILADERGPAVRRSNKRRTQKQPAARHHAG